MTSNFSTSQMKSRLEGNREALSPTLHRTNREKEEGGNRWISIQTNPNEEMIALTPQYQGNREIKNWTMEYQF